MFIFLYIYPLACKLLCFPSMLSAYEAKLIWRGEENSGNHRGPDLLSDKHRLALRLPLTLISPAFKPLCLTHTVTNTHTGTLKNTQPQKYPPPTRFSELPSARLLALTAIQTFSQLRSNRQRERGPVASQTPTSSAFICCVCVCVRVCVEVGTVAKESHKHNTDAQHCE